MLSGEIVEGDASKLEDLIQANIPLLSILALNSNGGNVAEAIRIGRIAHRYYLSTEVPTMDGRSRVYHLAFPGGPTRTAGSCLSACFFGWLGGVNRSGDVLGIHRPIPPPGRQTAEAPSPPHSAAKKGDACGQSGFRSDGLSQRSQIRNDLL